MFNSIWDGGFWLELTPGVRGLTIEPNVSGDVLRRVWPLSLYIEVDLISGHGYFIGRVLGVGGSWFIPNYDWQPVIYDTNTQLVIYPEDAKGLGFLGSASLGAKGKI